MKKRCAKAVDVAPKIFRLIVEPFRRDVVGSAPNFSARFGRDAGQSEIADFGHMFVGK